MSDLSIEMDNLKTRYREIFIKCGEELNQRIEEANPQNLLQFLNEEILKDVYERWIKILEYRKKFSCAGCAACCRLACSEFPPSELKQKAQNGDNFASQFVSVFIPYESEEEAKKIYPEYFELLKAKSQDENVYFYHCPKVTEDNKCPDYENRPQICKDFPDNPIGFLPKTCAYKSWKDEVETTALMLQALTEIVGYYKSKISG